MLSKIKSVLSKLLSLIPSLEKIISLAPFVAGILIGYALRTPIGWLLDIIKLLLRL